jgi:hypothetical protein
VLLDPGLNETTGLTSVDLTTHAVDAVDARRQFYCLGSTMKIGPTEGKKATGVGSSLGVSSLQGG